MKTRFELFRLKMISRYHNINDNVHVKDFQCKGHALSEPYGEYYTTCQDCDETEDTQCSYISHCCCNTVRDSNVRYLAYLFVKKSYRAKVNSMLMHLFEKVKYFPGNSGYLQCKSNFESAICF